MSYAKYVLHMDTTCTYKYVAHAYMETCINQNVKKLRQSANHYELLSITTSKKPK